jgi:hypothetical protein
MMLRWRGRRVALRFFENFEKLGKRKRQNSAEDYGIALLLKYCEEKTM